MRILKLFELEERCLLFSFFISMDIIQGPPLVACGNLLIVITSGASSSGSNSSLLISSKFSKIMSSSSLFLLSESSLSSCLSSTMSISSQFALLHASACQPSHFFLTSFISIINNVNFLSVCTIACFCLSAFSLLPFHCF